MPTDRGMDKENVVHRYNGMILSHKKEQNNTICSNKKKKKKQDTNELIYQTETDSQT